MRLDLYQAETARVAAQQSALLGQARAILASRRAAPQTDSPPQPAPQQGGSMSRTDSTHRRQCAPAQARAQAQAQA